MSKHSPTPWKVVYIDDLSDDPRVAIGHKGKCIAIVTSEDDAALIVCAVNVYEVHLALLKRNLKRMRLINQLCVHDDLRDCPNHRLMLETEEAIKKAEENEQSNRRRA